MPSINLTDPINGTVTDATLIAANNNILETVINGGIDDANVSSGAALSPNKFKGFPNDPTKALLGDGSWGSFAPPITTVHFAPVTIVNTAVLTSFISYVIPGGTLGTNKTVRVRMQGDHLNPSSGFAIRIQIKWGGTIAIDNSTSGGPVGNAARGPWSAEFVMGAVTDTGHQQMSGRFNAQDGNASIMAVGLGGGVQRFSAPDWASEALHAVDSTVNQTLEVLVGKSGAAANHDVRMHVGYLTIQ